MVTKASPDFPIDKVFPFLAVFAVANTALINMLMASRLLYGMAQQDVLPRVIGKVSPRSRAPYVGIAFSTTLALGLILYVSFDRREQRRSGRCQARRRCCCSVFSRWSTSPAWCCAARSRSGPSFFRSPGVTPRVAAVPRPFLMGPWVDRDVARRTRSRAASCVIGIVLWAVTWVTNRGIRAKKTGFRDIDHLEE